MESPSGSLLLFLALPIALQWWRCSSIGHVHPACMKPWLRHMELHKTAWLQGHTCNPSTQHEAAALDHPWVYSEFEYSSDYMRPSLETPFQSCHQRSSPLFRFFGGSPGPLRVDTKSFAQHSASSTIWHLLVSLSSLFLFSSSNVPVTKHTVCTHPCRLLWSSNSQAHLCSLSFYLDDTTA